MKWVALTEAVTPVVSGTIRKGQRLWGQMWLERHLTTYLHTTMDRRQGKFSFGIGKSVGRRVERRDWGMGQG